MPKLTHKLLLVLCVRVVSGLVGVLCVVGIAAAADPRPRAAEAEKRAHRVVDTDHDKLLG